MATNGSDEPQAGQDGPPLRITSDSSDHGVCVTARGSNCTARGGHPSAQAWPGCRAGHAVKISEAALPRVRRGKRLRAGRAGATLPGE